MKSCCAENAARWRNAFARNAGSLKATAMPRAANAEAGSFRDNGLITKLWPQFNSAAYQAKRVSKIGETRIMAKIWLKRSAIWRRNSSYGVK